MGRRTIIQDDISGIELAEAVDSTKVTVDGETYEVDLGSATKEHFIKWLSGDGAYNYRTTATAAPKATTSTGSRTKVNKYGYDHKDVLAWAIANGVQTKSGKAITESTKVLNQDVYDAYKAAQTK